MTVQNIGNQGLQFIGLSYPADFVSAASVSDCTSSLLLAAGASCELPIQFSPNIATGAGMVSESIALTDNNLNAASAQQAVTVTGQVTAILVPNVVGDTQSAATAAITAAGLTVGTVTTANSSTVPAGEVISESPAAQDPVSYDSPVSLVVSLGPPSYTLTISESPTVGGTVSPASGGSYTSGTGVNITAAPNPGYYLVNWTGSNDIASPTSASTTITMNMNESITANFAAIPGFVVTTAADDATGVPSNCPANNAPVSTNCTLRDALAAAAALVSPNGNINRTINGTVNITFSSAAFNAANTTAQNTITLGAGGTLNIPTNTTITGPTTGSGATLKQLVTVSGANTYFIFNIFDRETGVTINGLAIINGNANDVAGIYLQSPLTVTNSTFSGNSASAINAHASLAVINCTFSQNQFGGLGAAILADFPLTVTDSTFSGNSSGNVGGAIYAYSTLTVTNSTFSQNQSSSLGGAIFAESTL